MPLFSWMKWSHDTREQAQDTTPSLKSSGVVPSRMLITELLWHVEERERLARELEREHRLAHSALGLHWFQKYPRLRTLIPSSELHQLEFLCAQIPPIHAATVLSRCLVAAIPCSVLTLVCCQQWLAATESTLGLTAGKAEKTQREREAGRAAKKAIMCYCHRRRRYRVLTCEGEGHPVRLSEARLTGFPLIISASQFREVLASNNIRPWELAAVFKQVLRDFLDHNEYGEDHDISVQPAQFRPMEAWTSRYKMKQGFVTPTVPNCGDHPREEIPTVSGYVDRAMRHSSSFTATRDWDLPYYYPTPLRPKGAYSTTL